MANSWELLVETVIELHEDPHFKADPPPALQWYPRQWMGDKAVLLMGSEARGIHMHLMMIAWDERPTCSLPLDEELLRDYSKDVQDWERAWRQVQRAWRLYRDRWWQIGLVRSYLDLMAKRGPAAEAGRRGAAARWQGRKSQSGKGEMADPTLFDGEPQEKNGTAASAATASSTASAKGSSPKLAAASFSGGVQRGADAGEGGSAGSNGSAADAAAADRTTTTAIAAMVARLEDVYHRTTKSKLPMSLADRELVTDLLEAGTPPELLIATVREVTARETAKGNRVASFAYFHASIGIAVEKWQGSLRPEEQADVEEIRQLMLAKLDSGLWHTGVTVGAKTYPPVPPKIAGRARTIFQEATTASELWAAAVGLTQAWEKTYKEAR